MLPVFCACSVFRWRPRVTLELRRRKARWRDN